MTVLMRFNDPVDSPFRLPFVEVYVICVAVQHHADLYMERIQVRVPLFLFLLRLEILFGIPDIL